MVLGIICEQPREAAKQFVKRDFANSFQATYMSSGLALGVNGDNLLNNLKISGKFIIILIGRPSYDTNLFTEFELYNSSSRI